MNRQINFIKRNFKVENIIPFSFFLRKGGCHVNMNLQLILTNTYLPLLIMNVNKDSLILTIEPTTRIHSLTSITWCRNPFNKIKIW